ncbi:MAG: hypothetical protein LQ338_007386 [Usnochroma carphineum]|nr:MAG: hypothetical protein LQ338_007386 [Usnochroma carphineum]
MPAERCTTLCCRTLVKNLPGLTDIGDIAYEVIRPVLLKIENPKQLVSAPKSLKVVYLTSSQQILEEASPHLCGADEEIWISFIKRDIPDAGSKMLYPKKPSSWWKVYCRMRKDYEAEVDKDVAKLKAAFNGLKAAKDKRKIQIMEGIPKLPKLDGMQFAHAAEYNRIKKPVKIIRPTSKVLQFENGSKIKVLTGKGIVDKARREALGMSRFPAQNVLATPTHQLNSLASRPPEAPLWRVEEIRRASPPKNPSTAKPEVFASPIRPAGSKEAQRKSGMMTTEYREGRLRALTNLGSATRAANTTFLSTTSTTPRSSAKRPSKAITTPTSITSVTPGSSAKRPSTTATTPSSTTLSAPKSSAKKYPLSSSAPSSTRKPETGIGKAPPETSSTSALAGLKRKAVDSPIIPSIEVDDSARASSRSKATPSPAWWRLPQLKRSPSSSAPRLPKKKSPVDPFLPAKRRRIS